MLPALPLILTLVAGQPTPPSASVRAYLRALHAMDAVTMERFLAGDFVVIGPDGTVPFEGARGLETAAWERVMKTNWGYQIIGEHGDSITVIATERSEFYRLLGFRTEVSVFVVRDGLIRSEVTKYLTVSKGSQDLAYGAFKRWLLANLPSPEPDLVGEGGHLYFSGRSAPKMLAWLRKWHASPEGRALRAGLS